MAITNLTSPIDIQAVIGAVKKHRDLLVTLDTEEAGEILRHFTAIPGIKDSIVLGKTTLGRISHKYTGQFIGQVSDGKVVPRTLTVYPCVMEMDDEPERYRRTYITEVKGGFFPKEHPFEIWLNNYGVKCASKELHDVMLTAKYDSDISKTDLSTSFDGLLTIVEAEKTKGTISAAAGNLHATGKFTRADIGTKLLEMWRSMPGTFRAKRCKLFLSMDLGDLYDDWLDDQSTLVTGSGAETANEQFLRGTNRKVELVRMSGFPDGSQFVMITTSLNVCYGYDSDADFKRLIPFEKGNPYHYTAAGKYVLGFQFVSIDKSELCVNDQPVTPVAANE
ncbi:MAG: hypothetical protein RR206_04900 [Bacteroidaceae bacterium]